MTVPERQPAASQSASTPIRTFHARRGRLSAARQDALVRLWPRFGLDLPQSDIAATLGQRPVVLEIGAGMGEATLAHAVRNPQIGILAAEVHTAGVAHLLSLLDSVGIANVRVVHGDAVTLLGESIRPRSLVGARIYFPDPWPKARHHKRRLVQPDFVHLLADRLCSGATVHCATDDHDYAEQMLAVLSAESMLANCFEGFAPDRGDRPASRYEQRALDAGRTVHDLVLRRL